jgi:hypothetical protein
MKWDYYGVVVAEWSGSGVVVEFKRVGYLDEARK